MRARKKKIAIKLSDYVRTRYDRAVSARSDLFDTLSKCVKLMDGSETPDADGVDVSLNIVAPIVLGTKGLLRDVLANADEKPWTVVSTPLPDLPAAVEARLADEIAANMPEIMAAAGGDESQVRQILEQARNTAVLLLNREAVKRARAMETTVSDDLVQGGWSDAFDEWLVNFCTYPFAVLKAPSPRIRTVKAWDGDSLTVRTEEVQAVENISPFNFLWAPNATSLADAEYLIERRNVGADELVSSMMMEGYDSEAIEWIFEEYPDGYLEPYESSSGGVPPELTEGSSDIPVDMAPSCDGTYDTIGFYGRIKGATLKEYDIEVEDEDNWYEAEVWMIGCMPYKVSLNPDPAGYRPFRLAAYNALPGQLAGRCPTLMLEDVQRVCNASARALVRNMALASGVIGEVDAQRVNDGSDPRILYANQLRVVTGSRSAAATPAYTFHNVDSHAAELMGVFDKFLALGYELLGIPRVAFGSTDGLGTIGRTSGGLSMVMNQASKSIKDALRTVERKIVEPTVQAFVDWNLMYNPDPTIKGDVHAHARGVSGVLEREAQAQGLEWALQSIVPLTQAPGPDGQPLIPQQAVLRLLYSLFQSRGIPTEGILPDFDGMVAGEDDLAMVGAPQADPATVPSLPSPGVPLDGRSAAAAGAIAESNSL